MGKMIGIAAATRMGPIVHPLANEARAHCADTPSRPLLCVVPPHSTALWATPGPTEPQSVARCQKSFRAERVCLVQLSPYPCSGSSARGWRRPDTVSPSMAPPGASVPLARPPKHSAFSSSFPIDFCIPLAKPISETQSNPRAALINSPSHMYLPSAAMWTSSSASLSRCPPCPWSICTASSRTKCQGARRGRERRHGQKGIGAVMEHAIGSVYCKAILALVLCFRRPTFSESQARASRP